jgi:hypothetical protein
VDRSRIIGIGVRGALPSIVGGERCGLFVHFDRPEYGFLLAK